MEQNSNPARQLQGYIAEYLNDKITYVTFLAEDRKDIEFEIKNNLQKTGMAAVIMTPTMKYLGRDADSQAWECIDLTIMLTEYVPMNRAKNKPTWKSGFDIAFEVNKHLAGPFAECGVGKFSPKGIEQGEDNGLIVTKITFDAYFLDKQEQPEPPPPPPPTTGGKFTLNGGSYQQFELPWDYNQWKAENRYSRSVTTIKYDTSENRWVYEFQQATAPGFTYYSDEPSCAKSLVFNNQISAVWSED